MSHPHSSASEPRNTYNRWLPLSTASLFLMIFPACETVEPPVRDHHRDPSSESFTPTLPQNLQVRIRSDREVQVSWEGVYAPQSRLKLYRRVDGGELELAAEVEASAGLYLDSFEMEPGHSVQYRADTVPPSGAPNLPASPTVTYRLVAPSGLAVLHRSESELMLQWSADSGPYSGTLVERKTGGDSFQEIARLDADAREYLDRDLHLQHRYHYRVSVFNARHSSPAVETRPVEFNYSSNPVLAVSKPIHRIPTQSDGKFIPNTNLIAIAGWDLSIRIWDISDNSLRRSIVGNTFSIPPLQVLPDGSAGVSIEVNNDGTGELARWNPQTGEVLMRVATRFFDDSHVALHPTRSLAGINFTEYDDFPFGAESEFILYNLDGTHLSTLTLPGTARNHTFHPVDHSFAYSTDDTVVLHDLDTGQDLWKVRTYCDVTDLSFSPDGSFVGVTGRGACNAAPTPAARASFKLLDARTGQRIDSYTGTNEWNASVRFDPAGLRAYLGPVRQPGTVVIVEIPSGKVTMTFRAENFFTGLDVSPDGKYLAAASQNDVIVHRLEKLWQER